jgi:FkbM family methyltransferase
MSAGLALQNRVVAAARHRDLIFDIGMNNGEDTDFYLKKGFRVVAVEADPSLCAEVADRYPDDIASHRLEIVNRAISRSRAPLRFYVCRTNSAWSTACPALRDKVAKEGEVFEEIEVQGMLASDLVARFGVPHYAKIDIEGLDLDCLEGLRDAGPAPRFLSIEVDFYRCEEMIGLLASMGYERFALVSQLGVRAQTPPRPAREGRAINYAFGDFCSGLFGEEMPEPWLDLDGLRARCRRVVGQHRLSGALRRLGAAAPPLAGRIERARRAWLPLAQDWYDVHATI